MKKFCKNLISIVVFLAGSYQTVCIVDGTLLLAPAGHAPKIEVRFMPSSTSSTKETAGNTSEKHEALPANRVVVTPVPAAPTAVPAQQATEEFVRHARAGERGDLLPAPRQEVARPAGRIDKLLHAVGFRR